MSGSPDLPPDPMTATKNALGARAGEMAQNHVANQIRRQVKGYLPSFLHPLIPGEKGTVGGKLQASASKYIWGVIGSILFTLFFFGAVVLILGVLGLYIAYVVMMG